MPLALRAATTEVLSDNQHFIMFGCHTRSPLWRALLAENRNGSEASPIGRFDLLAAPDALNAKMRRYDLSRYRFRWYFWPSFLFTYACHSGP